MTILIVFFIIVGLASLPFLRNQETFERYSKAFWNHIGRPTFNHYFVTTDRKIILRYVAAFVLINSGNIITKVFCTTESIDNGKNVKMALGIEYGTFDAYTLCIDIIWLLAFVSTLLYLYKKEAKNQAPRNKTLVVMYGAKIEDDSPLLSYSKAIKAFDDDTIPADGSPFKIQMDDALIETGSNKWINQDRFLTTKVRNELFPFMKQTSDIAHVSLFAIAPMPLLVRLGTLLNEKYSVEVYQKHRNPDNWNRLQESTEAFIVNRPSDKTKQPVLVLSLSDTIIGRIDALYGSDSSIWEVTVPNPNMDVMRTKGQQVQFCQIMRELLSEMSKSPAFDTISVHMAVPVSCAIELGRVWMPKAHNALRLYDYSNGSEHETITIKNEQYD